MATENGMPPFDPVQEKRRKHAEYMRRYYHRNKSEWKKRVQRYQAKKKATDPEVFKAKAAERSRKYRERKRVAMTPEERDKLRADNRRRNAEWKAKNPDHWRAQKRKNAARRYAENPQKCLDVIHRRRGQLRAGSVTKEDWAAILARYKNRCAYCRRGDVKLGQDHVLPLSKGGRHEPDNVVPCCWPCNTLKNDREWPYPEPPV